MNDSSSIPLGAGAVEGLQAGVGEIPSVASNEPPRAEFKVFHVDDCMYVAAVDENSARAHVKDECGDECGEEEIVESSLAMRVTTANVDDGEEATPDTMTTVGALVEEHLKFGGTLPYTVCFDAGL